MKALCALLVCFVVVPGYAQGKCSQEEITRHASTAIGLQKQLRAVAIDDDNPGDDVPAGAQALIPKFKSSLAQVAEAVVACHTASDAPAAIEHELVRLLHANPPQPPSGSVRNDDPRYTEFLSFKYGSNLLVHVTRPADTAMAIESSFHIECGDDTVLLLFQAEGGYWRPKLVWQAPPFKAVSGAFGDIFKFAVLSPDSDGLRVVVAHGHPWCTSRFSGFNIDLLAPSSYLSRPRVLWHTERSYSRGDFEESLRSAGDTFELRVHDDEMHFDMGGFERLVVYRYRVNDDKVTRIEPIAANGRGFVEEWVSMPWDEAKDQTALAEQAPLEAVHKSFEQPHSDDVYLEYEDGPVRACITSKQFQVQVNRTREFLVTGVPGGRSEALPHTYFRILETGKGYEMIGADTKPDPTCSGPDLMKKRN